MGDKVTGIYPFARRQNQDSSVDSICATCYETIASGTWISDIALAAAEQNHVCNPSGEFNYLHWDKVYRAA